jgi:hypothetical protein
MPRTFPSVGNVFETLSFSFTRAMVGTVDFGAARRKRSNRAEKASDQGGARPAPASESSKCRVAGSNAPPTGRKRRESTANVAMTHSRAPVGNSSGGESILRSLDELLVAVEERLVAIQENHDVVLSAFVSSRGPPRQYSSAEIARPLRAARTPLRHTRNIGDDRLPRRVSLLRGNLGE